VIGVRWSDFPGVQDKFFAHGVLPSAHTLDPVGTVVPLIRNES